MEFYRTEPETSFELLSFLQPYLSDWKPDFRCSSLMDVDQLNLLF